jgi:hypothetical protein
MHELAEYDTYAKNVLVIVILIHHVRENGEAIVIDSSYTSFGDDVIL